MPPLTTLLIRRLFFFLLLGILVRAEENEDKPKKWNKQRGRVNKVDVYKADCLSVTSVPNL